MKLSALHSCLAVHPCKQSYREVGAAMSDKQTVIQSSSSSFTWPRAHPPMLLISPVWNLILGIHTAHRPSEEVCRLILHIMWLQPNNVPLSSLPSPPTHSLSVLPVQQRTNLCLSLLLLPPPLLCSAIIISCFRVGPLLHFLATCIYIHRGVLQSVYSF